MSQQVSTEFVNEGMLRQIGAIPQIQVLIEGVDLSAYVAGKPRLKWETEQPGFPGHFLADSTSFTLDNGSDAEFSPFVASNFFTAQGLQAHGYHADVTVNVGYQLDDGTTEWVYGFVGKLVALDPSQDRKRVQVSALDLSTLMRREKAHNIGHTFTGAIWEGADRDWYAREGVYLPISKDSWSGTKNSVTITPVSSLRTYGDLDYTRGLINWEEGSIELEGDPPTSDPVTATYKYAYRDAEYHGVMKALLTKMGITNQSRVERALLEHPDGSEWFTPRGRFGPAFLHDELCMCRALVYDETLDELYAGVSNSIWYFDYSEGVWAKLCDMAAGYIILKMCDDADYLYVVASYTLTGDTSNVYKVTKTSGSITTMVSTDANYEYPYDWGGASLVPYLDSRRGFFESGDYVYYRREAGSYIGCYSIHKTTLALTKIRRRSDGTYPGAMASWDFVIHGDYCYSVFCYDDGTYGVAQTLKVDKSPIAGGSTVNLCTETFASAPYPTVASDVCYADKYDRIYFTLQNEESTPTDAGAEFCYVPESGGSRVVVDSFDYTQNAARSTIQKGEDVYYISGATYEGNGPGDTEGRGHLFVNSGAGSTDLGLIWYATTDPCTGTPANMCVNTTDDVLLMVSTHEIDFPYTVYPFVYDNADVKDYRNSHLIQWGNRLACVVPVYDGNDQDIWTDMVDFALAAYHEIGFDSQGRFFFRQRPSAPATLSANITSGQTSFSISDADLFLDEALGDTGWIALVSSGVVEIAKYTTLTGTTLSGVERGLFGSTAASHSQGDAVYPLPYLLLNAAGHKVMGRPTSQIPDFEGVFNRVEASYGDTTSRQEDIDARTESEGSPTSETQFGQRTLQVAPRFWTDDHYPNAQAVAKLLWDYFYQLKRRISVPAKWIPNAELGDYTVVNLPEDDIDYLLCRVEGFDLDTERWVTTFHLREV